MTDYKPLFGDGGEWCRPASGFLRDDRSALDTILKGGSKNGTRWSTPPSSLHPLHTQNAHSKHCLLNALKGSRCLVRRANGNRSCLSITRIQVMDFNRVPDP